MIEQALYEHLCSQDQLSEYLTQYNGSAAVFNQEAPADSDPLWGSGPQYGRIVFAVDIQGDPERTMGGLLSVDIMCKEDEQYPEDIEPILRPLIHGWFFSNGTFTVSAQWKNSSYFTEPKDHVTGCTLTFDLLAFPILTTSDPDVIDRINAWTAVLEGIHVLNYDALPSSAWRPAEGESAVYWRVMADAPAKWIADNFSTIYRTATLKGHVFSASNAAAGAVSRMIVTKLYSDKRLLKTGESPIMVNQNNQISFGSDPMKTGQISVDATYGIIIVEEPDVVINNIIY